MPDWMQRGKTDDNKGIEIKPEDLDKALEPSLTKMKTELDSSLDAKLKPIADFIANQKKEKEEADRAARAKADKEARQNLEVQPEDWITDPEAAVDKKLIPLVNSVQVHSSIIMRDKVLSKMDYYATDPQFAAKVDALIDSQPLANRSNTNVILNAYKTVHYDMQEEIKNGKIKSFASMTNLSNNGTGGHSGSDDKKDDKTLSPEEKNYARRMGLTDEQWIEGRRELEYV